MMTLFWTQVLPVKTERHVHKFLKPLVPKLVVTRKTAKVHHALTEIFLFPCSVWRAASTGGAEKRNERHVRQRRAGALRAVPAASRAHRHRARLHQPHLPAHPPVVSDAQNTNCHLTSPITNRVLQQVLFHCSSPGIPLEYLTTPGTAAIFTVWHEDMLLPNDFLGEVRFRRQHK